MCGRYLFTRPVEAMRRMFRFPELPNLQPRWNIAPTQAAPVVRLGDDGRRHLAMLRWGLVPAWAKDLSVGARSINARAESVAEKPTFREALRRRRCLVPADGYYEWVADGRLKQPYRFTLADDGLFAFAGLWERWRPPAGEAVETFCFVTTEASTDVAPIHDRMPVILDPADWDRWLAPGTPVPDLLALLRPYPANRLVHRPVSRRVNDARVDDPALAEPVELEAPRLL